jgi:hypothetical protein
VKNVTPELVGAILGIAVDKVYINDERPSLLFPLEQCWMIKENPIFRICDDYQKGIDAKEFVLKVKEYCHGNISAATATYIDRVLTAADVVEFDEILEIAKYVFDLKNENVDEKV